MTFSAGTTPWTDTGYVFTRPDGLPINPNYATTRFRKLVHRIGLPPVRLHDLRHGAASLAHPAGADLKTLQDLLGHSSVVVTADYTSVLPEVQRRCADATANLVLNAARRIRKKIRNKARNNRPIRRPKPGAPAPTTRLRRRNRRSTGREARGNRRRGWHPRDTHRPHRPDSKKSPNRTPAARTPVDLARPKGLEPLTF
ncbi:tyrosine-type recombinase/integrase [Solwaraspora sp. WMMD406]|uniref:site-specific integrase n=1 Tax=Solwaraspora sp. WMMD406 TaxID=3016095 RepID=UPI0024171F36|nr:tyrosine-type recombinase/integrase [Solwaraspora sp. WMMD406]MDG4762565.1 tyrosine-type recombinase/integrase [Solwaraspora sp. WMMD406]